MEEIKTVVSEGSYTSFEKDYKSLCKGSQSIHKLKSKSKGKDLAFNIDCEVSLL